MSEAGEKKENSKKQSVMAPAFVTLVQLRERWLKKKAEEEEERKLKELHDEEERRRKSEETKQQKHFEAIQRNSESSGHRPKIGRAFSDVVMVASAQSLGEGNEDDEVSKGEQDRKSTWKKKKKKKKKETARAREKEKAMEGKEPVVSLSERAREKEKAMGGKQPVVSLSERTESESILFRRPLVGKEVRMEYRPKIKNVDKEISNSVKIENECLPSRKYRGKRAGKMKFQRSLGNVDEENYIMEMEAKLAEVSIEERKSGLEIKDGVGDDGLYQTGSRAELNRALHVCNDQKTNDRKYIRGDGELNHHECQDRSDGRFYGSKGRGDGGRGSKGRGDGRGGSKGRGIGGRGSKGRGYGVWVRRQDVGSGGEVTVKSSGVQLKDTTK
ncbi:hypothetical protein LINGRAHAP2_LOCUS10342 [Linum grandiflorum]